MIIIIIHIYYKGDITKVLLYHGNSKLSSKSGIGKAMKHQQKAMNLANVDFTTKSNLTKNSDFDIMHVNTYSVFTYLVAKNAKRKGKKIIYHAHSTEEDFRDSFILSNQISKMYKRWLIYCYSLGDVILTPTVYSKKLLEGYGIKKDIIPISNGIDLDYFKYDADGAEEFRKSFGFSKHDKIIISVGLYIERKGILDFIKLAKMLPEYKFIWFGYTPPYLIPSKIRKAIKTKLPNLFFPRLCRF